MLNTRTKSLLRRSLACAVGTPLQAVGARRREAFGLLAPIRREAFISLIPADEDTLEIGPFDRPKMRGPRVSYFDVLSQDGLRERARTLPGFNPETCPFIEFVSPTGDLAVVDRQFSSVFSSHVIEHQPDLIKHLSDVARLVAPGGCYYLIIPDQRYCFDHYVGLTCTDDIRGARGRRLHADRAIADHYLRKAHNNPLLHWLGLHGRARGDAAEYDQARIRAEQGEYVDVHAWTFTPASFRHCLQELFEAGETGLEPIAVHDTMFPELEFMAVLRKPA